MALTFVNLPPGGVLDRSAREVVFLTYDSWDDWFEFSTLYTAYFVDSEGALHRIGPVKIGEMGMPQGQRRANIPDAFQSLSQNFFSLGQDEDYYNNAYALGLSPDFFIALRDIAYNPALLAQVSSERVLNLSLMRSVAKDRIESRFHRLATGNAVLSSYSFGYQFPKATVVEGDPFQITFNVKPDSMPPSNIHVLIGRNGVGKTTCMNDMVKSFLGHNDSVSGTMWMNSEDSSKSFSNIISVAFSAFDSFFKDADPRDRRFAYIGLKDAVKSGASERLVANEQDDLRIKTPEELAKEFVSTVEICRTGVRRQRWRHALEVLSSDALFAEADVVSLLEDQVDEPWPEEALRIFRGLSSGHKIVLLTISRLVELVQEQSLVLIDEPEGHLHPPLLSAFIRALSDLLAQQNGASIVATHSPVVLQEVPASCVWRIDRSGRTIRGRRPGLETFGEEVGILTHEIFGLEVTETGFYKLIKDYLKDHPRTFDQFFHEFGSKIGSEGLSLANALIEANREAAE